MGTEAFLVCHEKQTAYELGKFMGTWSPIDWTETDFESFSARIVNAYCGEDGEYVDEGNTVADARRMAHPIFNFCADHDWKVKVVERDWFFDHNWHTPGDRVFQGNTRRAGWALLGSRYAGAPNLGLGYDLPVRR